MSRADWVFFCLLILGVILFLIGANYYNSLVGWLGVFLFVGSVVAWILLYVYNWLKNRNVQKP